jgi:hypothetical protein
MVKTIPAIPGNVRTPPNPDRAPKIKNMLIIKATLDATPPYI